MSYVGRALLRTFAIFLIIGGIAFSFIGNEVQEANTPNEIQFGYVSNGETVIYDSGYIGGNLSNVEEGGSMSTFGIVLIVVGVIMLIASFFKGKTNDGFEDNN